MLKNFFSEKVSVEALIASLAKIGDLNATFKKQFGKPLENATSSEIVSFISTQLENAEKLSAKASGVETENYRLLCECGALRGEIKKLQGVITVMLNDPTISAQMEKLLKEANDRAASSASSVRASSNSDSAMLSSPSSRRSSPFK